MTQIEIFEPALCCATGVCGPEPDDTLARFGETVRRVEAELAGTAAELWAEPAIRGDLR